MTPTLIQACPDLTRVDFTPKENPPKQNSAILVDLEIETKEKGSHYCIRGWDGLNPEVKSP